MPALRIAQDGFRADATKLDIGGPRSVLRGKASDREPLGLRIDDEQSDACQIAPAAGGAGADQEFSRTFAVQHQRLGTVEHIALSIASCRRCDVVQVMTRLSFA